MLPTRTCTADNESKGEDEKAAAEEADDDEGTFALCVCGVTSRCARG